MRVAVALLYVMLCGVEAFIAPRRSIHRRTVVTFGGQGPVSEQVSTVDPPTTETPSTTTMGIVVPSTVDETLKVEKEKEELSETQKLLQQVKDAGTAGVISYALWELAFWFVSVPVVLLGYQQVTGHWPDLSDGDDIAKLSAEAFAFVNFARLAVPLRIGTWWISGDSTKLTRDDRFGAFYDTVDPEQCCGPIHEKRRGRKAVGGAIWFLPGRTNSTQ